MTVPRPSGPDVDALVETAQEIAAWHRHGADFCSNSNEALKHENWADALDSLAALARSAADMEEALRKIAALPTPALQGGREFFAEAQNIALAAVRSREQQEPQA